VTRQVAFDPEHGCAQYPPRVIVRRDSSAKWSSHFSGANASTHKLQIFSDWNLCRAQYATVGVALYLHNPRFGKPCACSPSNPHSLRRLCPVVTSSKTDARKPGMRRLYQDDGIGGWYNTFAQTPLHQPMPMFIALCCLHRLWPHRFRNDQDYARANAPRSNTFTTRSGSRARYTPQVCDECLLSDHPEKCRHKLASMPRWLSSAKVEVVRKLLAGALRFFAPNTPPFVLNAPCCVRAQRIRPCCAHCTHALQTPNQPRLVVR